MLISNRRRSHFNCPEALASANPALAKRELENERKREGDIGKKRENEKPGKRGERQQQRREGVKEKREKLGGVVEQ